MSEPSAEGLGIVVDTGEEQAEGVTRLRWTLEKIAGMKGVDLAALEAAGAEETPCQLADVRPVVSTAGGIVVARMASPQGCDRCHDSCYEPRTDERGVTVRARCPGWHWAHQAERLTRAQIPARFAGAKRTHVSAVLDDVRRVESRPGAHDGWRPGARGWWLYGDTGRGKTHALAVALRFVIARHGVDGLWVRVGALLEQLRNTYGDRTARQAEVMAPVIAAPVLVLDELGSTRAPGKGWKMRQHEVDIVTSIIDARWEAAGRTTWITSNASPEQIRQAADWQSDRLVSRLMDVRAMHPPLHVGGEDWRLKADHGGDDA